MVVKALEQTMAIISPKNAFLGRKQVNLIAEKRPRTLEAFLSMSLHGLSKHMRTTHGPAIIETLRQVPLLPIACVATGLVVADFISLPVLLYIYIYRTINTH